jgi:hypothetical protein
MSTGCCPRGRCLASPCCRSSRSPVHRTPYTVPFAGAGFLVYVVDQQRRTVELVGMIWLGF